MGTGGGLGHSFSMRRQLLEISVLDLRLSQKEEARGLWYNS